MVFAFNSDVGYNKNKTLLEWDMKMKIRYFSDIHDAPVSFTQTDEDVIVLAGDISENDNSIEFINKSFSGVTIPILFIPGNHDFYNHDNKGVDEILSSFRQKAEQSSLNIVVMDNCTVEIGDVEFIGSTGWTDFSAQGPSAEIQSILMYNKYINDIKHIKYSTVNDLKRRFLDFKRFLHNLPQKNVKTRVLVTHFAPVYSLASHYSATPSSYWITDINENDYGVLGIDLHIHGHTHNNFDYTVVDTHVVCTPCNRDGATITI